ALPAAQGDAQSWISELAKQADARSSSMNSSILRLTSQTLSCTGSM
nr:hypothetical protein [Tanacetum cinerariifolium]